MGWCWEASVVVRSTVPELKSVSCLDLWDLRLVPYYLKNSVSSSIKCKTTCVFVKRIKLEHLCKALITVLDTEEFLSKSWLVLDIRVKPSFVPCSTSFLKALGMMCKMHVMMLCGLETTRSIWFRWVTFQLLLIDLGQRAQHFRWLFFLEDAFFYNSVC